MTTVEVALPKDVKMEDADTADMQDRKRSLANGADKSDDDDEGLDMKSKALTNLLKTSSVFVAIMADKMKEQQKQNAERARREATKRKNAESKANESQGPSRRSVRTHRHGEQNGEAKEDETQQEQNTAKKGGGRPKKEGSTKEKKGSIVSYLDKKQMKEAEEGPTVQEALAEAADSVLKTWWQRNNQSSSRAAKCASISSRVWNGLRLSG